MANYKVIDGDQLDNNLKSVADSIRAKAGLTSRLYFPDGYVEAISNIEDGMDLPILINPGTSADLLKDKELIDQSGSIVTGSIVTKTASNVTTSGATVTVPSGYYAEQVSKSVSTVEQATPEIAVNSAGLITASSEQDAGYVIAGTKSSTKQLTTQAAQTITPGTSNKTISSGRYLTGTQTIKGDTNLTSDNIANGVTIFGVTGTHVGGITPEGELSITANGTYNVAKYETAKVSLPTATQATPSITVSSTGLITASATQAAGVVSAGTKSATKQLTTQAAKTITPSTSAQTAVASGVYTTGKVTVSAMPTATQATPTISVSPTGVITASSTQTAGYVPGGTKTSTEQLPVQAAKTWTPSVNNQTISSGLYLTGTQTIKGDTNLVASNIKSGITIFDILGTCESLPTGVSGLEIGYITPEADISNSYTIYHNVDHANLLFLTATNFSDDEPNCLYFLFGTADTFESNGQICSNAFGVAQSTDFGIMCSFACNTGTGTEFSKKLLYPSNGCNYSIYASFYGNKMKSGTTYTYIIASIDSIR